MIGILLNRFSCFALTFALIFFPLYLLSDPNGHFGACLGYPCQLEYSSIKITTYNQYILHY